MLQSKCLQYNPKMVWSCSVRYSRLPVPGHARLKKVNYLLVEFWSRQSIGSPTMNSSLMTADITILSQHYNQQHPG